MLRKVPHTIIPVTSAAPKFDQTSLPSQPIQLTSGERLKISLPLTSDPVAKVSWSFKPISSQSEQEAEAEVEPEDGPDFGDRVKLLEPQLSNDSVVLSVDGIKVDDSGEYTLQAVNEYGSDVVMITVQVAVALPTALEGDVKVRGWSSIISLRYRKAWYHDINIVVKYKSNRKTFR